MPRNRQKTLLQSWGLAGLGGLPMGHYANMYVEGASAALTLTDQNTWYQVVSFGANGAASGATPDHTNDHITINKTAYYLILLAASFSGTASSTYEIQCEKNNGATDIDSVILRRALGASGDVGSSNAMGVAQLTAADTLEVWARCTSAAGKEVTPVHLSLSVVEIG